ncbi:hypothetical protein SBA4_1720003 [Candidatus Sulfopaludibacter sp. SbA4]|nr:hypothetical protein SBA4_1720003 [Candidatus Sulfopaludibacter sp. SbA4]
MGEGNLVQLAPLPGGAVGAELPLDVLQRCVQRFLERRFVRLRLESMQQRLEIGPGCGLGKHRGGEFRHPDFVDEGRARVCAQGRVPVQDLLHDLRGLAAGRGMPVLQDLLEAARGERGDVLLHALHVVDAELLAGIQHLPDAAHAERQGPAVVSQRDGVSRWQDVVIGGRDVVARRVEFERQLIGFAIALPFVAAIFAGHRQQAGPALADGGEAAHLPTDVAGGIGVDQVFAGDAVVGHGGAEVFPVLGARQVDAREVPGGARLAAHPTQHEGPMVRGVFVDHGSVDGVAQRDGLDAAALHGQFLLVGLELLPRAAVAVFVGAIGIDGFDVEVLLIDAHDGESESDALVVAESDAGQSGLARSDGVPPGPDQVHGLAQGRQLHGAVRIVGEDGMSGGGHGSVHHPVVAALLGRQAHGSHGLAVGGEDVGGDRGKVEAWGNLERDCGLQADELEGALQAESLDVLGVGDFAREVAGHGEAGDAAEAILGGPEAGGVAGDCELGGKLARERANVRVDAVGEGGDDEAGVGAVGGPLGVPIAVKGDGAGQLVALDGGGAEDFSEFAGADAPPQIDLEQAVLGGDVALGEEEIVDRGGVDVGYSPAVAEDLDLLLQSGSPDVFGREESGEGAEEGERLFHAEHHITWGRGPGEISAQNTLHVTLAVKDAEDFKRPGMGPVDYEVRVYRPEANIFASGEIPTPVADVRMFREAPAVVSKYFADQRRRLDAVAGNVRPDVFDVLTSLGREAETVHARWRWSWRSSFSSSSKNSSPSTPPPRSRELIAFAIMASISSRVLPRSSRVTRKCRTAAPTKAAASWKWPDRNSSSTRR